MFIKKSFLCNMSASEYLSDLCGRCESVYHRYENGVVIPLDHADDLLKEFQATRVDKNVFRSVSITWLKHQPRNHSSGFWPFMNVIRTQCIDVSTGWQSYEE